MRNSDFLLRRNQYFFNLIKSKIQFNSSNPNIIRQNLQYSIKLGRFAWRNHPGVFTSAAIENLLVKYGVNLTNYVNSNKFKKEIHSLLNVRLEYSTLHVATILGHAGGHTRVLSQIIRSSQFDNQKLVLTDSELNSIPDWFKAIMPKTLQIISLKKYDTIFEKAYILRLLSSHFKRVILYHHPFDIVPIIAFSDLGNVPIILDNHAHSWFYYGISIADIVACHSEFHTSFTQKYRNHDKCFYLLISQFDSKYHIPDESAKRQAKKRLQIDEDKTIILTVGTKEKLIPNDSYNYFKTLNKILNKNPNVFAFVIGINVKDKLARKVIKNNRVVIHEYIEDLKDYYLASDICLQTMPQASLGVQIIAAIIGLSCPFPKYGDIGIFNFNNAVNSKLYRKYFMNNMSRDEFFYKLKFFINNKVLCRKIAWDIRSNYLKDRTPQQLLDNLNRLFDVAESIKHIPRTIEEQTVTNYSMHLEIASHSEFQRLAETYSFFRRELSIKDIVKIHIYYIRNFRLFDLLFTYIRLFFSLISSRSIRTSRGIL